MLKKIFLNKKTKIRPSGRQGFTLLELITVIAIIAIISAISWSTLGGAKKQSDVNNACEQVAAMINKTRNYALSGKFPNPSYAETVFRLGYLTMQIDDVEVFKIPGGVDCTPYGEFRYKAPGAIGLFNLGPFSSQDIICKSGTASRTVSVTPFTAVCK
ncbi:MAG: prepilin-type N-terminal cleavage/methylation domain-containing protein [Candidatus Moraniibacteriota bacterium]